MLARRKLQSRNCLAERLPRSAEFSDGDLAHNAAISLPRSAPQEIEETQQEISGTTTCLVLRQVSEQRGGLG